MSRRSRILLAVAAGLVLLLVALALLLPLLVDVDRYREPIRSRAEAALGRPVALGPLRLSVLPRLALSAEDLAVSARPDEGGGELLAARRLDVGAALWPLLSGRLEVSGITVREPVLTLRRGPDGSLLLPLPAAAAEAGAEEGDLGPDAAGLEVRVDRLSLRGGRVLLAPAAGGEPAPLLEGLDLGLSPINPGSPLGLSAEADWIDGAGNRRPLALSGTLAWPGEDGVLQISDGTLHLADSSLGLGGRLETAATPARIDLQIADGSLAPADVVDLAGVAGLELPVAISGRRPITLSGRLQGPVGGDAMPRVSARLGLQEATLAVPDLGRLDAVSGQVDLDGSTLKVSDLTALLDGRPLAGEATARLVDGGVELEPLRLDLLGGRLQGSARLDLSGSAPGLGLQADLAGVDMGELMALATGSAMVTGTLDGRLQATSAGAAFEEVVRAAVGDGRIELTAGHLSGLDVLDSLTKAAGLFGEQSLEALSDRLAREGTDFTRLAGPFQVRDGSLVSPEIRLESRDLALGGEVRVDLLAAELDGAFTLVFSESLSRTMKAEGSRAARVFWDSRQARVVVPLTLTGPLDAPAPGIDWKEAAETALEGEIGRELDKRGLGDTVRGLLGRDKAPAAPAPEPAAEASAPEPAGDPAAAVTEARRSGNFLAPDLRLSGWVAGTRLLGAALTVTDADGRELLTRDPLPELAAALPASEPDAPMRVGWSAKIDGKQLLAATYPLQVRIAVRTEDGREADSVRVVSR